MLKILYLYPYLPYPNVPGGGQQWAFNFIRYFGQKNEITLACMVSEEEKSHIHQIRPLLKNLIMYSPQKRTLSQIFTQECKFLFSRCPLLIHHHYFDIFLIKIIEAIKKQNYDFIFCDNIRMALYAIKIKEIFPKLKIVFRDDEVIYYTNHRDFFEYLKLTIKGFIHSNSKLLLIMRLLENIQIQKLTRYEKMLWNYSNLILCVSPLEKLLVSIKIDKKERSKVKIITHGIHKNDIDYKNQKSDNPPELIFIGNYLHYPNVDSVQFFYKKIFPLLYKKIPEIKITIFGHKSEILKQILPKNYKNIKILGYISDLKEIYSQDLIFICPIRLGGGLRTKLLEIMGHEIPVISTRIGMEGFLGILNRKNDAIITNSDQEFVDNIVKLYTSRDLRTQIGSNGRKLVLNYYLWDTIFQKLELYFQKY